MLKKILTVTACSLCICVMSGTSASAKTSETVPFDITSPFQQTHVIEESKDTMLVETDRSTVVNYEDDLVIKETEISYQRVPKNKVTSLPLAAARATAYKTDEKLKISTIGTTSGKNLLRIDQYAEFKYNGSYAYVSDKEYVYYTYNKASFVNRTSSYTKSSAKSSSKAKYSVAGDLKWTANNKAKKSHWTFNITCTPSGVIQTNGFKS